MNQNVKLGLMALAAGIAANRLLAGPFSGLTQVQKNPALAYGGTVAALLGTGAIVHATHPRVAVMAAGAGLGLGIAGYQAGAYNAQAPPPGAPQKTLPAPSGSKALPGVPAQGQPVDNGGLSTVGGTIPGGGFIGGGNGGVLLPQQNGGADTPAAPADQPTDQGSDGGDPGGILDWVLSNPVPTPGGLLGQLGQSGFAHRTNYG